MVRISNKSRHIRFNHEKSPDNVNMERFHFVIVDDKYRDYIKDKIYEKVSFYGHPIIEVRTPQEGRVVGSKFRYLFISFDSSIQSGLLKINIMGRPIKNDGQLREKKPKRYSIEDYVADTYSK